MTIKLNGSTAGSVSLDAPASTTSSADIQFKLPVADGSTGQVLQTDGSGNLSWVSLPSVPTANPAYTYVDEWYLTSNQNTGSGTTIWTSSNLARDTTRYKNGTAMTVDSNGAFTFPATGVYLIRAVQQVIANNVTSRYIGGKIEGTTDNSNYVTFAESVDNMSAISGATYVQTMQEGLFDVENTSTHKVRFNVESQNNTDFKADSNAGRMMATFIRLGDTP